jgi:hypothetical protein
MVSSYDDSGTCQQCVCATCHVLQVFTAVAVACQGQGTVAAAVASGVCSAVAAVSIM